MIIFVSYETNHFLYTFYLWYNKGPQRVDYNFSRETKLKKANFFFNFKLQNSLLMYVLFLLSKLRIPQFFVVYGFDFSKMFHVG